MIDENKSKTPSALLAALRRIVGVATEPRVTRDDVNQAMIRHWCDAMTDHNPVYTDPAFAAESVHGGIVAPPAMLDTWSMPGLAPRPRQESSSGEEAGMVPVLDQLDAAGFTSVVAAGMTHEYHRYLRPGDRLTISQVITSVSDEKQTALGVGHFFTTESNFADQQGNSVGRMEFNILKFKPGTGTVNMDASALEGLEKMPRPRPAISRDTRFFWDGIDQGELRIQKCKSCDGLHHPPVVRCPGCGSYELGYLVSQGRGTVYSFVEVHHPQFPMFDYPLIGVLVELEEGTRIISNLVGVKPEDVEIGMPVELAIEATDPGLSLPLFRRARPARRESTLVFADLEAGQKLPPCPVAISRTLIVAGAIASRDFQDVHHDPDLAKKRGSPDTFMNIMTTSGLTNRYVTDWAGPDVIFRKLSLRLGVPNFPGDTLTYTGQVQSTELRDGKGVVELLVTGTNKLGDHVTATVELELPTR